MAKKIRKIFTLLILVILGLLLFSIRTVRHHHFQDESYYKQTQQRLDDMLEKLQAVHGKVEIGIGKSSITPRINADRDDPSNGSFVEIPLAGYGDRKGKPATGVHDSLYVKVMALKVDSEIMILAGADILIIPPQVTTKVGEMMKEQLGLDRHNLYIAATHTHSGPGAWSDKKVGEMFSGKYNHNVETWLSQQIFKAVQQAVNNLKPGSIGSGTFDANDYIRNRLTGKEGNVNPAFTLIKAEQEEGLKIVIGSFDAHTTTLSGKNMEFSGDYAGYWQRKIESYGYDMAIFMAGAMGSQSGMSKGEGFERPKYIGEALADSAVVHLGDILLKDSIKLVHITLPLDIPSLSVRVSNTLRLNRWLAGWLFPGVGDVHMQAAKIDDLMLATTPADFSGETALLYKNAMSKKGYKSMITGFNGSYVGYVLPADYYFKNSYESRLMNWFGPGFNSYVNYTGAKMLDRVSDL
ncbi:MAG: neutral/alkaline non-lysosomal ceramidase N-terminal domain-containing protein [Cyclobacteriaceae bacterium]|nr:neutral/alkaline non-lysosomal ceramidase N-terminal domain-containing protein [Cyclobacteriaceae bacterium]